MTMTPFTRILAALLCAGLTACGSNADLKESLGITHRAPDEFRVYSRPPLTVPPEFDLHPPGEGGNPAASISAETQAHDTVLGNASQPAGLPPVVPAPASASLPDLQKSSAPAAAVTGVSSGDLPSSSDSQFLNNAGAGVADPHVRQKIKDETAAGLAPKDETFLISGKKEEPTVDATKEAARLKSDKDQNKPPTAGDTPVNTPKDKGLLGDIF